MPINPLTHEDHAAEAEELLRGCRDATEALRAIAHTQLALYRHSLAALEITREMAERAARQQDDIASLMASDPSRI